jgi:hypothetical protein
LSRLATLAVAARIGRVTGAGAELMRAVDLCLRELDRSPWPEVAWGFSRLTTSRHPVEFGFSTATDTLRLTLEVAGPDVPERLRLDAALELLARLGTAGPNPARIGAWRGMQAGTALRWGCWLSLRQQAGGFAAKLYIEVPRDAVVQTPRACPGAGLRMVGHDLASGASEYYFAWPRMTALECERRLDAVGVAAGSALVEALEGVIGMPRAAGVSRAQLGISLADDGRGAALFVDSASVSDRAAALHRRMAIPGGSYADLLGERGSHELPHHGIVTLIPRAAGVELRAGIAADALAALLPEPIPSVGGDRRPAQTMDCVSSSHQHP